MIGGFGLALTTGISGVGAAAGIVVGANGFAAAASSIGNLIQMCSFDDVELLGNSGLIGLGTSLATDNPTLNAVAGFADVGVNCIANPIAVKEAATAVERHFATGTYGRMLWDVNHYRAFGSVDRLKSAEEISQQLLRPTATSAWLSRIGTAGSCVDATLNILK